MSAPFELPKKFFVAWVTVADLQVGYHSLSDDAKSKMLLAAIKALYDAALELGYTESDFSKTLALLSGAHELPRWLTRENYAEYASRKES